MQGSSISINIINIEYIINILEKIYKLNVKSTYLQLYLIICPQRSPAGAKLTNTTNKS